MGGVLIELKGRNSQSTQPNLYNMYRTIYVKHIILVRYMIIIFVAYMILWVIMLVQFGTKCQTVSIYVTKNVYHMSC